jgi:hypothetical protein
MTLRPGQNQDIGAEFVKETAKPEALLIFKDLASFKSLLPGRA